MSKAYILNCRKKAKLICFSRCFIQKLKQVHYFRLERSLVTLNQFKIRLVISLNEVLLVTKHNATSSALGSCCHQFDFELVLHSELLATNRGFVYYKPQGDKQDPSSWSFHFSSRSAHIKQRQVDGSRTH